MIDARSNAARRVFLSRVSSCPTANLDACQSKLFRVASTFVSTVDVVLVHFILRIRLFLLESILFYNCQVSFHARLILVGLHQCSKFLWIRPNHALLAYYCLKKYACRLFCRFLWVMRADLQSSSTRRSTPLFCMCCSDGLCYCSVISAKCRRTRP